MDLEIQGQHVDIDPAWRQIVEERATILGERFPWLLRMHVTFRRDRHHEHGAEGVHVLVNAPGESVSVTKEKPKVLDALHAALDAVEREVRERHVARREARRGNGAG